MLDDVKDGTSAIPQAGGQPSRDAGAEQSIAVPKGLERFAGQDGKIDLNKLGEGYLNLEKGFHKSNQELSALQRAYQALAPKAEAPMADPEEARGREFENFVKDPKAYTEGVARASVSSEAKLVKAAILELAHPEMKDMAFKEGLNKFAATLPPNIQASLDDYNTADWVIKLYKQQYKPDEANANVERPSSQHIESPSGTPPTKGGKTYKRSEILEMQYKHPAEYEAKAEEISQAYREGRVIKDM